MALIETIRQLIANHNPDKANKYLDAVNKSIYDLNTIAGQCCFWRLELSSYAHSTSARRALITLDLPSEEWVILFSECVLPTILRKWKNE